MSQISKAKRIEDMTQEELEVLLSALDATISMLREHIDKILERAQPIIDSLRDIQAKRQQILDRRVRKI